MVSPDFGIILNFGICPTFAGDQNFYLINNLGFGINPDFVIHLLQTGIPKSGFAVYGFLRLYQFDMGFSYLYNWPSALLNLMDSKSRKPIF